MRRATLAVLSLALLAWGCGPSPKTSGGQASSSSSGEASGGGSGGSSGATYTPGQEASTTLGPAGGTLSSPNGRVDLVVPPGAFAQDTQVNIQQVGVTEPDGTQYTVYELGPDGMQFPSAPYPRLVLHYTTKDLEGTAPEALAAAFQNPDGTWSEVGSADVDLASGTVSAPLPHFSKWKWIGACHFIGDARVVFTGDHLHLSMVCVARLPQPGSPPFSFAVNHAYDPYDPLGANPVENISITINGIAGGNSNVGTADFETDLSTGNESAVLAYTPPVSITRPGTLPIDLGWDVEIYSAQHEPLFKKTLHYDFTAAQRDWLLELRFFNNRACGPPANEECSYTYESNYSAPITITPLGEHDFQVALVGGVTVSGVSFKDLHECSLEVACTMGPDGSTKGVEGLTLYNAEYSDSLDRLSFTAEIKLQDIPTYTVTFVQSGTEQEHTYQGTTRQIFTTLGPLEDGTVRDTTFKDQTGAERGAIWELHWTAPGSP